MMRKIIFLSFVFSTFFCLFLCKASYATRELSLDVTQLTRRSTDIVVAKCVSREIKKDEKTGFIFTYVTFDVVDSLKNKYGKSVVLRMLGGQIGDLRIDVPHRPQFKEGESVVLFLGKRNTKGYPVLKGASRSVYRIQIDENGREIITTPVVGLDIYRSGTNQKVTKNDKIFLEDFLYSLSQIIN